MDYSKLSNEELIALKNKDYSKLSDATLLSLKGGGTRKEQQPGMLDKVGDGIKDVMGIHNNAQQFSPQSMLNSVPDLAHKAASKVGDFVEGNLTGKTTKLPLGLEIPGQNMNPSVAKGVNNVISAAPDVAMLAAMPEAGAVQVPSKMAAGLAGRAAGLGKKFRLNPFARGKVAQAGKDALMNDVISKSGNAGTALERATEIGGKVGQELGAMREAAGPAPLDDILAKVDEYASSKVGGRTGGHWDDITNKVGKVKDTLRGIMGDGAVSPDVITGGGKSKNVKLNDVVEAKNILTDSVNYLAEKVSKPEAMAMASKIEEAITQAMRRSGQDMTKYKALKSLYGSMKLLKQGLNPEIAGLEGGAPITLRTGLTGAALAPAGPAAQIAGAGMMELAKRRGAGVAARSLYGSEKIAPRTVGVDANLAMQAFDNYVTKRKKKKGEK